MFILPLFCLFVLQNLQQTSMLPIKPPTLVITVHIVQQTSMLPIKPPTLVITVHIVTTIVVTLSVAKH